MKFLINHRDFARDVRGSNENEAASSSIELKLSEYPRKLDDHVKRRYMEKISVIGVYPCLIPEEKFNLEVLQPVEATDLLSYLVLNASFYTKQQFKSFRSLKAYNQMVSGFITSVQGCIIAKKFLVRSKVRHSQRMNDPPIPVWIICSKDGIVICAHCIGCMTRLGECSSHVASVLFYIEIWTRLQRKLASTQVKCTWILPTNVKEVQYDKAKNINFTSAKKLKDNLDESGENLEISKHSTPKPGKKENKN